MSAECMVLRPPLMKLGKAIIYKRQRKWTGRREMCVHEIQRCSLKFFFFFYGHIMCAWCCQISNPQKITTQNSYTTQNVDLQPFHKSFLHQNFPAIRYACKLQRHTILCSRALLFPRLPRGIPRIYSHPLGYMVYYTPLRSYTLHLSALLLISYVSPINPYARNLSKDDIAIPVTGPVVSSDWTISQKGLRQVVTSRLARWWVRFRMS